jgi:hypothetical protein
VSGFKEPASVLIDLKTSCQPENISARYQKIVGRHDEEA